MADRVCRGWRILPDPVAAAVGGPSSGKTMCSSALTPAAKKWNSTSRGKFSSTRSGAVDPPEGSRPDAVGRPF